MNHEAKQKLDLRPHFITAKQLLEAEEAVKPALTISQENAVLARMPDRQRRVLLSIREAGVDMKQIQEKLNECAMLMNTLRNLGDAIQHFTAILALPDHKHTLGQSEWDRMTKSQQRSLRELFSVIMLPTAQRMAVVLVPNNRPHDKNEAPIVVRPFHLLALPPVQLQPLTQTRKEVDLVPETDDEGSVMDNDDDDYVPPSPDF